MKVTNIRDRAYKDPNKLTPYEEKIHELMQQGLKHREIAAALGGKRNIASISSTISVIKDKLGIYE